VPRATLTGRTFKVSTYAHNDGAVPGRHQVAISPPPPRLTLRLQADPAKKYNDFGTSGPDVEIRPGTNNVEFELEPRAVEQGVSLALCSYSLWTSETLVLRALDRFPPAPPVRIANAVVHRQPRRFCRRRFALCPPCGPL